MKRVRSKKDLEGLTAGTKSTGEFALEQGKPMFICDADSDDPKEVCKKILKILEAKK